MMKSTVTAVALAATLAFAGGPALASQCPKLIAANKEAIASAEKMGTDMKKIEEAKRLNAEAQKLHDAGKHADSVEAAKQAKAALGA